jgi:hypothetical protein
MKTRLIFTLFFSLFGVLIGAQEGKKEEEKKKHWKYEPNFMVGFDVLNGGVGFFSDRKLYQGFVSSKLMKMFMPLQKPVLKKYISEKWL